MNDSTMLKSQLKSLEAQLRVMEARLPEGQSSERRSFGDLFGSLSDQAESSDEDIDAILYKVPPPKRTKSDDTTSLNIHDAIIVATALVYKNILKLPVEIVTKDTEIQTSGLVPTCW